MAERRIEYMPLSKVKPAKRNVKGHDIGLISASVGRFGYADAVVIDERTGRLVSGHGRVETLTAMKGRGSLPPDGVKADGAEWLVPVQRGWSSRDDHEAEAFLVAANKTVDAGGWDEAMLAEVMADLAKSGGLEGTGFDGHDVDKMINDAQRAAAGLTDADAVPDVKDVWVKLGDLFELGAQRIVCGDSTDAGAVDRVMGGEQAQCVWTDPPYGVEYEGGTKDKLKILNDDAAGLPRLLAGAFASCFRAMGDGAHIYVAHPPGALCLVFFDAFRAAGLRWKQHLVWDKGVMVLGHSDHHYRHEPIIYGMKPGEGRIGRGGKGWYGDDSQVSVLEYPKPKSSEEHPTMKPIELVEHCLKNSSAPGHIVFEPFSGSGTTLLACERLERRCRAIELDPRFVQVALERWEAFTGKKAEKVGS